MQRLRVFYKQILHHHSFTLKKARQDEVNDRLRLLGFFEGVCFVDCCNQSLTRLYHPSIHPSTHPLCANHKTGADQFQVKIKSSI